MGGVQLAIDDPAARDKFNSRDPGCARKLARLVPDVIDIPACLADAELGPKLEAFSSFQLRLAWADHVRGLKLRIPPWIKSAPAADDQREGAARDRGGGGGGGGGGGENVPMDYDDTHGGGGGGGNHEDDVIAINGGCTSEENDHDLDRGGGGGGGGGGGVGGGKVYNADGAQPSEKPRGGDGGVGGGHGNAAASGSLSHAVEIARAVQDVLLLVGREPTATPNATRLRNALGGSGRPSPHAESSTRELFSQSALHHLSLAPPQFE